MKHWLALVLSLQTLHFTFSQELFYKLPHDESIYADYQDNEMPHPECSVVAECPKSVLHEEDEIADKKVKNLATNRCNIHVNCYEYKVFPSNITKNATILTIQGSFFQSISAKNLKNLTGLIELVMEFNELQHIEARTFVNHANLEALRLHGNKLNNITERMFFGLMSLKILDLSNNGIESVPEQTFSTLPLLESLDLSLNQITVLNDHLFCHLVSLKCLYLQQNNITQISRYAFNDLSFLETLNLNQNHLKSIPFVSFKVLTQLKVLLLNDNPIFSIARHEFNSLHALEQLWIERCQLSNVAELTFHGKKLTTLSLINNDLNRLPDLGNMTDLETLLLHGNPWTCDENSIPMLNWLQRHIVPYDDVLCVEPIHRRGNSILDYSSSDFTVTHTTASTSTPTESYIENSIAGSGFSIPEHSGYETTSANLQSTEVVKKPSLKAEQLFVDASAEEWQVFSTLASRHADQNVNRGGSKEDKLPNSQTVRELLQQSTTKFLSRSFAESAATLSGVNNKLKQDESAYNTAITVVLVLMFIIVVILVAVAVTAVALKKLQPDEKPLKQIRRYARKNMRGILKSKRGVYDLNRSEKMVQRSTSKCKDLESTYGVFFKPINGSHMQCVKNLEPTNHFPQGEDAFATC